MSEQQLVEFEEKTVLAAFTDRKGLDPLVTQAQELVSTFEHDMKTAGSRAKTASLAAKVSKFKTTLDGMGKDLVADWKSQSKVVDASRKKMRDALDDLKIEARKPLTDWEFKVKQEAAEKLAAQEAERLLKEFINDHEFGLLMDQQFDSDLAAKNRIAEESRIAEEVRLKTECDAAEKLRAEAAEETERQRIQDAIRLSETAKQEAEQAVIQAEANAKAASEEAERQRIRSAEEAKQSEAAAVKAEQDRQAAEIEADRVAQQKLEANKAHVGKIRKSAKESLMQIVDEETAKKIVLAISKGEIENVSIKY